MKDKFSIIKNAQKYSSKGQLDKAIAEWEKLLDDGKDGNIHNTIGDLYFKKGDENRALDSFSKAAEIYKKDGFFPKAIAIHKKILNIEPNAVDSLIALGKLNEKKGLIGNAIENYFKAAEIFKRDGANEKALMAVEKIVQLSPPDINTRMKIADLYLRIGSRERAANEYISIAESYARDNDQEKSKEFFEKAAEIDPGNSEIFIGLSSIYEKMDDIEKAFEYLRNAHTCDPDNRKALTRYADMAMRNNRTDEAKKILLELTENDPNDLQIKTLLASLYMQEGLKEEAWNEVLPCIDTLIKDKKWSEALHFVNEYGDLNQIPVKKQLIDIFRGLGDESNAVQVMTELANIYKNNNSLDEALTLYKDTLDMRPGDQDIIYEIQQIEVNLGIAPPADVTSPGDSFSTENIPISPSELLHEKVLSLDKEDDSPEISLPGDNMISPVDVGEEVAVDQENEPMSAKEFAEKRAEADFYAQQGINDEAIKIYERLIIAFPENQEIKKELDALKSAAVSSDEIVIEKMPEERGNSVNQEHDDLQDILDNFGQSDEESDAHYQSGLELKQQGSIDDAIEEFLNASKDPAKEIRSKSMLAECYIEKGNYPLAIAELTMVLEKMSVDDPGYINIKYQLANAYEKNKDFNKAVELYSEIRARDPEFRDVSHKIQALESSVQQAPETPNQKKNRVSYI